MKTFPQDGQKVTVHYALFLVRQICCFSNLSFDIFKDTCEFIESSRIVGVPFTFTMGAGEVITGFEEGTLHHCFPVITRVCRSGSDVPGPESVPHPVS